MGKPLLLLFLLSNSSLDPVKRLLSPLLSALRNSDTSYLLDGCLSPGFPPHGDPVIIVPMFLKSQDDSFLKVSGRVFYPSP